MMQALRIMYGDGRPPGAESFGQDRCLAQDKL
jgi:hypothetical protein